MSILIVAGHELHQSLQAEKARLIPRGERGYDSEALCKLQRARSGRGILGAELVLSMYGWSVRYDSGLQDWGLLASARSRQLDGTLEAAVKWAADWVAQDPDRRYVWRHSVT